MTYNASTDSSSGFSLAAMYLSLRSGYWLVYLGPFDTPVESQHGCWSALNKANRKPLLRTACFR